MGSWKYVQIDYKDADSYIQVREVTATPMGQTVDLADGFSLMNLSGVSRISSSGFGDEWNGSAFNNQPMVGVTKGHVNFGGPPYNFVLSLNGLYDLAGFGIGMYQGNQFPDLTFEYLQLPDDMTDPQAIAAFLADKDNWTTAKWAATHGGLYGGGLFRFDDSIQASYIRVSTSNAHDQLMSSFDLFLAPVPEPATMSLLALGGLAMLRRRRR